jgi:hypothetical protein
MNTKMKPLKKLGYSDVCIKRTEQQYILNSDLKQVYNIYKEIWNKIIIPRKIFYVEKMGNQEKKIVMEELGNGHNVMYKQEDIVVIDFKTLLRTINKRVSALDLSSLLNTTVIDYSNWEEISITIASKGKVELSINIDIDFAIEGYNGINNRFEEIISEFQINNDIDVLGYELEEIFKVMNIKLEDIFYPKISTIQEAITFDIFYWEW